MHNEEYDIPAPAEEYEGFKKLIGHVLGEYFDVYFKILNHKGDALIRTVKIKQIDFDKWPELSPAAAQRAVEAAARRYICRTYAPIGPDRFAFANADVSQYGKIGKGVTS